MREDELKQTLKKYAETINQLNKNQQVLVKEISTLRENVSVNQKVEEIIKQTQAATKEAETKTEAPATEAKAEDKPAEAAPAAEEKPAEAPAAAEEKKEEQ